MSWRWGRMGRAHRRKDTDPPSRHRNLIKFKGKWFVLQRNLLAHYHQLFAGAEEAFDIPTYEGIKGKNDVKYVETLRDLYKLVYEHNLFEEFQTLYGEKRLKNLQKKFMTRELHGK